MPDPRVGPEQMTLYEKGFALWKGLKGACTRHGPRESARAPAGREVQLFFKRLP